MAARIYTPFRVSLLLLSAAWNAKASGQADTTSPARPSPVSRSAAPRRAPKSAPPAAEKRVAPSTKSAANDGPAGLVQKRFTAAQAAEQQGDFIRAESEYRQALGLALEQLGEVFHTLGDLEKAESAYRGAIEASSDSDAALLGLAVVYLRQGQFQKGVDTVRLLLAQKPMHSGARQLLGKLYFSMNRFDAAALELTEAQRLNPDDSETATTLAFTYLRQRQLEKAQKIRFSRTVWACE